MEDLVGFAGLTPDYDDRTWGGVTVTPTGDPVVDTGSWTWTAPKTGETVGVAMRVTMPSPDEFFWKYDVTNNDLSQRYPQSPGMAHFGVGGPGVDTAAAYDVATSVAGWTVWESGGSRWAGTPDIFGYGPAVARGDTASLTFRTRPCPVVPATGTAAMALWPDEDGLPVGIPLISVPQGAAKGPGEVKVEITKWNGARWGLKA